MDKFSYQENEIVIGKSQCEFCCYNNENEYDVCVKFSIKPEEIAHNRQKCAFFKPNTPTPWQQ